MYPVPEKTFAQLDAESQRVVRLIIEEQAVVKAAPDREVMVQQLISYVDNGHARIYIHSAPEGDKYVLQIHPNVLAAIKNEVGVE